MKAVCSATSHFSTDNYRSEVHGRNGEKKIKELKIIQVIIFVTFKGQFIWKIHSTIR